MSILMEEDQIIYPVSRLLANPRVFHAIANYLGGPDGETLKSAFYDLLEYDFGEYEDVKMCEFEATEVSFKVDQESGNCEIVLDSGIASLLEAVEGEIRSHITNDNEMAATSAIYQRLVNAIEEAHPELGGNIALCSPPTPGNSYLRSPDGDNFQGSFHLLTDPEKVYAFNVEVIDVTTDQLKAYIKPI
jgi:hypothetical protein